jgi:hypothetical protein
MKKEMSVLILCLIFCVINGHAKELVFPKQIACGPVQYNGRIAWITEIDGKPIISLKRPIGTYVCDTTTENSGHVSCSSVEEPLGMMPLKIEVVYSESTERWMIKIADFNRYVCDPNI